MQKSALLFFILVLALSLNTAAQPQKKTDSLKALLNKEKTDSARANIYNRLASLYRLTDPQQQKEYAAQAISTSRRSHYSFGLANGYNMYAQSLENEGHYETALLYYDSALTKWQQVNREKDVARIYLNMSNVYNRIADYPSAADYCLRSLKLQENLHDTFGVAVCRLTLGNVYYSQQDYKSALSSYEEAYRLNRSSEKDAGFEGAAIANIGAMFEQLGAYDSALYYTRLSLSTFIKSGAMTKLGASYDNIGSVYKEMNRYDSAMYYYRRGLTMHLQMKNREGVCGALVSIAELHNNSGHPDSAIVYYQRALLISKQIGTRDNELNIYDGLSKVYRKKKQYELALDYLDKYVALNDTIHGSGQNALIGQLQKSYEIDKKNKAMLISEANAKLATAEAKLAKEHNERNVLWFTCGSVLLLLIILAVVLMLRNKQKHNRELERKNEEISFQKEEITASITYARRIQQSVMPDERILQKSGYDYFILNKPRDIVTGDFYWLAQKGERMYIAVADCTGHGVPGALVSVIGINLLNKIIEQPGSPSPSEILELLHVLVIQALNKDADARETKDGMDIGLLCIDREKQKAFFSGAGRPLYYSGHDGFHFLKGDRYSVAGEQNVGDAPFTEHEIALDGNVTFYLSSDGYVDQFGEATGKKYLSKRFQDLLAGLSSFPLQEQVRRIDADFVSWKGKLEQIDDVLVLGIRV